MEEFRMIGHRHDRSFEELSESLFQATLMGDEPKIRSLQDEMRQRFGNLF